MENNLKYGVIVDFFGLPGSGKSTIAHSLAIALRQGGYQVSEPTYLVDTDYSTPLRLLYKMFCALKFTFKHPIYLYQLFSMIDKKSFIGINEAIRQWINVCFTLVCLNKKSNHRYTISDEGIVQAAISLTIRSSKENIMEIIEKLTEIVKKPIVFVYVKADIDIVLERLEKRNNGKSRVDQEIDPDKRKYELSRIKVKCCIAEKYVDSIDINNLETSSIDDLVELVLKQVKKRLNFK